MPQRRFAINGSVAPEVFWRALVFIIALTIYLKFGSDNGGDHA